MKVVGGGNITFAPLSATSGASANKRNFNSVPLLSHALLLRLKCRISTRSALLKFIFEFGLRVYEVPVGLVRTLSSI